MSMLQLIIMGIIAFIALAFSTLGLGSGGVRQFPPLPEPEEEEKGVVKQAPTKNIKENIEKLENKQKKYCPLPDMSICDQEKCAWYVEFLNGKPVNQCAVQALATALTLNKQDT